MLRACLHPLCLIVVLAASVVAPPSARAETYDTCKGFIDSLPAVVSQSGVWCLRQDLSTGVASGNAITVNGNNITIDCNRFRIGGLAAGNGSNAVGIYASSRQNVTVRQCNVRGFYSGIAVYGGAGHLVEDNRLDNNLAVGIRVSGDNNLVQRNRVYDTGGYPGGSISYGIWVSADAIDNTVAGVFASAANSYSRGLYLMGDGNAARGNRVRGLVATGTGLAAGIFATGTGVTIAGNHVTQAVSTSGVGIDAFSSSLIFCTGNTVANYPTAYFGCDASVDNLSLP